MKRHELITIVADDRERESGVVAALSEITGVTVATKRLSAGDYLADGRLLFERKTLADFAVSVVDGRLFRQACALRNAPHTCALILEGTSADLQASGVRREALQGAMISVSLILGIPVLRSLGAAETARLICYAARQLARIAAGVLPRPGYRPKGKPARQLYLLQGLPGVGRDRAQRLLEAFGSVENVLTAGARELAAVDGIGAKTAERIRWLVSEKSANYAVLSDFDL